MKNLKRLAKRLWEDESGQGTAEYVLILVGIVAVGFMFKKQLMGMLEGKLGKLSGRISSFQ